MNRHGVIKNASWIIGAKIIQSVLALVVNMLTARYLGPSNYGIIHYAASLTTFAVPLMQLGLNSILVQEIVQNPKQEGRILGTCISLSLCSSVLCILGILGFAFCFNAGETVTIVVCGLYSLILVFQALELVQYWFQAKLMSKYTSLVSLGAYVVVAAYRIFLLVTGRSVYWFSVANAFDCLLIAAALLILYRKLGGQRLSFSGREAKRLLKKSRYFIVSSLMITVFSQTDRVMLKLLIDETATGYYSAAISCALLTNFVFSAIMDSMRPSLFYSKQSDPAAFEKNIKLMFSVITWLALAQCLVLTVLADLAVKLLYGQQYAPSADVLRLAVWYTLFSYIGAARSIWILAEGRQKYLWVINLSGAVINVMLNLLLIPSMAASGAAMSTLLTQFFTNIVVVQLIPDLRPSNALLLRSLDPRLLIQGIRSVLHPQKR